MSRRPPPDLAPAKRGVVRFLVALIGAAGLAGCSLVGPWGRQPGSTPAPDRPVETLATDPLSIELAAYYQTVESRRIAHNLMRTDSGAGQYPITAASLTDDYVDIALREEHSRAGSGFGGNSTSVLRRWAVPVRYVMEFGPAEGRAQRLHDHAQVAALTTRLAAASGHPISLAPLGSTQGNFHVLVLSEAERQAAGPRLRQLIPGIDEGAVRLITEMSRETYCLAMAFSRDGSATYTEAVAVIRAEHPDLTRQACFHEELTQGLGLASDSARARPSIFNDDQEFALITDHDLLLLKIHYDPRLRPGMTETTARPIVFAIASELVAGET